MDVDAMLAEITPEKFDEWMEMNSIIPFGDEKLGWVMASGFAAIVSRLNLLATAWGCKDLKDPEPKDFIVWRKKRKSKPKREEYINPNQAAMMFQMAVGNGSR